MEVAFPLGRVQVNSHHFIWLTHVDQAYDHCDDFNVIALLLTKLIIFNDGDRPME